MKNLKQILTAMYLCMALAAAASPVRQRLHDDWQFRQARLNNWYPATVPGTVHTDLMANRIIEDPYFRLNERGVQWVDKEDWIYETHFEAGADLLARERIELVFEGLDTYADVYLNDEKILTTDNMFRRWRTEVKRLLRPGENALKVYFHSPIKVDLPKYDSLPYRYEAINDQSANGGLFDKHLSVFARKAGYHYGWDWGPRLVTSGIWRPVYLEGWNGIRIRDVFYRQEEVTAERARVQVEVEINAVREQPRAVVTVTAPGEGIEASVTTPLRPGVNHVTVPLDIASPKRWWTRELGEPHLYEFRTSVAAGDASDSRTTRIGLRSLRLVREKVSDGTTFRFELNGEPLFAKGANYIPCDVFLPRVTRAVYEKTIDDAAAVNMNMLRVWGGGVYEDDVFYELCDERGILVWQDFMFACSIYPAEGAWLENVRLEAEDNIRRLRNHPSIAVWCGNNECNDAWFGWGWNTRYTKQGHPEYDKIIDTQFKRQYYEVLPEAVAAFSPGTPYHPSSPWSCYEGTSENSEGDTHFWRVWHSRAPIAEYNTTRSRFFSEYGFQSFPEYASVLRFAPEERDQDIESEVMMAHQRGGDFANMRIRQYLEDEYWPARDFRTFLYMSHVLQGDAIKTAIEAHRRDKPYCWGSLFWQHNDCWPVASWASRDWYGRWKAQHYFARPAFDDLLVSPCTANGRLEIFLVSDRRETVRGKLETTVLKMDGTVLSKNTRSVTLAPNTVRKVYSADIPGLLHGCSPGEAIVVTKFTTGGRRYSNIGYFAPQKELALPEADIRWSAEPTAEGYAVTLTSDRFVRAAWLSLDGNEHFEDNYFDLLPGVGRTVEVSTKLSRDEFDRLLRITHLQQTR
ncbi:beta-mannosidase [Alistipes senegalensis]|uniref:beta-mannosidase n=1 Tax=Alistipes senegalensis TaxID=1288121 RepID=UPI00266FF614|nr:glycoside hydrolase family 2 protein [Alistipes senegalensis]